MAERHCERQVQMLYAYDRLGDCKISQVYKLLVPERVRVCGGSEPPIAERGDRESEDSGDLCAGVVGEAKGRTNHR